MSLSFSHEEKRVGRSRVVAPDVVAFSTGQLSHAYKMLRLPMLDGPVCIAFICIAQLGKSVLEPRADFFRDWGSGLDHSGYR